MKRRQFLAVGVAAFAAPSFAVEDTFPSRPVTLVVPFPAAGAVDVLGRAIAMHLADRLEQPVVVDNRPGAGGIIGATAVARAPNDGYTLLLSSSSTHSLAAALKRSLPYDPEKSFAPIAALGSAGGALLVGNSLAVRNVAELVSYMKQSGEKNTFGSAGIGTISHLQGEDFKLSAGVQATHVSYKGTSLAGQDLAAGRLTFMIDSILSAQTLAATGRVRMLAVTNKSRLRTIPDVPTMAEMGIELMSPDGYFGLWGPAGMRHGIVLRLNAALNRILRSASMLGLAQQYAIEVLGGAPEVLAARVAADTVQWRDIVKRGNISLES